MKTTISFLLFFSSIFYSNAQSLSAQQDDKNQLYGFIDENNKYVIKPIYKDVDFDFNFKNAAPGLYYVQNKAGKFGFVNEKGTEVIKCTYDNATSFRHGYSVIEIKKDEYHSYSGLIDSTGKITIQPQYTVLQVFDNNMITAAKELDSKQGVMDATGKIIVPFDYEWLTQIYKGLIVAKKDGKSGIIDLSNNVVVPFTYDDIQNFNDNNLAAAEKDGKWGFIDLKGKEIISCTYEDAHDINFGKASAVKKNGKWGVVDSNNKVLLPFDYYSIETWQGNVVSVKKTENEDSYQIDFTTKQKVK
jgi:hypothetical protein